jgi:hypothetical protein
MEPAAAAEVLRRAIPDPKKPLTVADASVASGLSLQDTEAGLTWLTSEYRGHLRVTEDGDLIHLFPNGFTKPWQTEQAFERIGRAFVGVGRFVVRAWLLIVMVGYALLFLALIIGMSVAKGDRDESPGLSLLGGLFRRIADALFWTFHPFSPLYVERVPMAAVRREEAGEKVAFYEKVNRFVFGPQVPREDPHAARAHVLEEIRARRGVIGLADVMRVTGLPRSEADPLMARLMLDHDGTVQVGDAGGIVYRFEELRKSAREAAPKRQVPAWERLPELPPLTGNTIGSDVGVAMLNGFNLLASAWVVANGFTLSNIALMFDPHRPMVLPDDGIPLALGVVPLAFSAALFVLPVIRMLRRVREEKANAAERARLLVLREVVTRVANKEPVPDETLRAVVRSEIGQEPTSEEITRRVVDLGGDVAEAEDGVIRYRFAELEADEEAAEDERAAAGEAKLGRVVFASDQ